MEGISNTLNCSSNCQTATNFSISGSNQTCTTAIYSVPNLPAGATVSWSIVPSNLIALTPNGNNVTLTGNYGGEFSLNATINMGCGNINLPLLTSKLSYPDVSKIAVTIIPCTGNIGFVYNEDTGANTAMRAPNAYYFEVESLDGTPIDVASGGWSEQISPTRLKTQEAFMFNPSYTHVALRVRYKGPCGFTEWLNFGYNCDNNSSTFSYYPNPTSNILTVTQNGTAKQNMFAKTSTSVALTKPYQIKLLNKSAKILVGASSVNGKDININTSSLPNGTYFLHIFQGREVIKKQIIIRH